MASGASSSGLGSGGMTSKLQAAQIAERAGIALAIVALLMWWSCNAFISIVAKGLAVTQAFMA